MMEAFDQFAELVPKLLVCDRDAEECFYHLAHGRLMAWADHNFHIPEADRPDFALEVMEKTLSRLDKFQPGKAKLTTWMFMIARNHALDRGRRQQGGRDPLHGALPEEALGWLETDEACATMAAEAGTPDVQALQASLARAMSTLSENEQRLFQLAYGTSLNSNEIGLELAMTSDAVRKSKQRLLKKIQSLLEEDFGPPEAGKHPIRHLSTPETNLI